MKTALITGGALRVGRAIAIALADRGYAVAIHYNTSTEAATGLVREIEKKGGRAVALGADLAKTEDTESLIECTCKALSPPDCLINNASTFDHDNAASFTAMDWDHQLNVNLRAPALLSRDFARALPEQKEGCIINLLDQRIDDPSPSFFTYMMSKSGLETLTKLNAIALAPRIRVCGVAPGLTLPSGTQTHVQFETSHAKTLLGRGSTVEGIVGAVGYLIDADTVTGQVIYVDGGERLLPMRHDRDLIAKD